MPSNHSAFDPYEGFNTKEACEQSITGRINVTPGTQPDGGTIEMFGPFAYQRMESAGGIHLSS